MLSEKLAKRGREMKKIWQRVCNFFAAFGGPTVMDRVKLEIEREKWKTERGEGDARNV